MQLQFQARWPARPVLSAALRFLTTAAPPAVALLVAFLLGRRLPAPTDLGRSLTWWAAVTVASLATLLVLDRAVRRLLPLAVLLRMSLALPDRMPSRFRTALRTWHPKKLQREAQAIQEAGGIDDEARAAEIVLALLASLTSHHSASRVHSERVRGFAEAIAGEMDLRPDELELLRWAALLHDIGKLGVPAKVLAKDGPLSDREWDVIRGHPDRGADLVRALLPRLREAAVAIRQHHERVDGTGYPKGLSGRGLRRAARIVSVADTFETMISARSYARPRPLHEAREELVRVAGDQLDPAVVRAFMAVAMGRLWRIAGIRTWLSQVPVIGWMLRLGARARTTLSPAPQAATSGLAVALFGLMTITPSAPADEPGRPAPGFDRSGPTVGWEGSAGRASRSAWPDIALRMPDARMEDDGSRQSSSRADASPKGSRGARKDSRPPATAQDGEGTTDGRGGIGLALGKGKETGPGHGLAMGVGKPTGPGQGLELGSAVEAPGRTRGAEKGKRGSGR